ncbi:hypothetical protein H920_08171 [Fukomys damarensis]|uniref:Uncharacterized protein n=1 Tax=Fukomys damarensis TaxID=885580 RepID=A0A091DJL1_FUKDA|nr:hypothetical protein H920_08171 [Fukomys damarensis]
MSRCQAARTTGGACAIVYPLYQQWSELANGTVTHIPLLVQDGGNVLIVSRVFTSGTETSTGALKVRKDQLVLSHLREVCGGLWEDLRSKYTDEHLIRTCNSISSGVSPSTVSATKLLDRFEEEGHVSKFTGRPGVQPSEGPKLAPRKRWMTQCVADMKRKCVPEPSTVNTVTVRTSRMGVAIRTLGGEWDGPDVNCDI